MHERIYHYLDVLQYIVRSHNARPDSDQSPRLKSPNEIYKTNEGLLWKRVYVDQKKPKIPRKKKPPKPFKFHLGDVVRISCSRRTFQSYYEQRWNEEVFTIKEIYTPWNSRLVDYYGGAIEWSFLQQRTSKVCKGRDDLLKMEKVKKRRKTNGIPEIYVKLLGYPKIFNNWIRESDGRHLHLILYSSERVNPSFFQETVNWKTSWSIAVMSVPNNISEHKICFDTNEIKTV